MIVRNVLFILQRCVCFFLSLFLCSFSVSISLHVFFSLSSGVYIRTYSKQKNKNMHAYTHKHLNIYIYIKTCFTLNQLKCACLALSGEFRDNHVSMEIDFFLPRQIWWHSVEKKSPFKGKYQFSPTLKCKTICQQQQ